MAANGSSSSHANRHTNLELKVTIAALDAIKQFGPALGGRESETQAR